MTKKSKVTSESKAGGRTVTLSGDGIKLNALNSAILKQKPASPMSSFLLPLSKFRLSWDLFIFIVIVYNSIVTPLRLSILVDLEEDSPVVLADYFFDAIFVVDTIMYFFFPFIDEATGRVVTDPKIIRARYRKSWRFYINVAACLPILNILFDQLDFETYREYVNLLRIIRVLHFMTFFGVLKTYMGRTRQVNESKFRMFIILFFALTGVSIFGCMYFFASVQTYREEDTKASYFCDELNAKKNKTDRLSFLESEDTWIRNDVVIEDKVEESEGCHYGLYFIRSIYYMMQTLFTIGYGDSVVPHHSSQPEMALACCFMLIGVYGYGLIIANMTSVLANVDVVSMRYRHEMDTLSKWMVIRSMPEPLKERINIFFHYIFRKQKGMLINDLFQDLPSLLKSDLAAVNKSLLAKVPFFNPKVRKIGAAAFYKQELLDPPPF